MGKARVWLGATIVGLVFASGLGLYLTEKCDPRAAPMRRYGKVTYGFDEESGSGTHIWFSVLKAGEPPRTDAKIAADLRAAGLTIVHSNALEEWANPSALDVAVFEDTAGNVSIYFSRPATLSELATHRLRTLLGFDD